MGSQISSARDVRVVLLAGGRGTRLWPLTDETPKPLVNLFSRPLVDYILAWLAQSGICEVTVTVGYRARDIAGHLGNGEKHGMRIRYFYHTEDGPLGTAGTVRAACQNETRPILVVPGDVLSDVPLSPLFGFHATHPGLITLGLHDLRLWPNRDISQFGVVLLGNRGAVRRFVEKPTTSRPPSTLVNTGIYLIEPEALARIAPGHFVDFGRDLFPTLAEEPELLFGFTTRGYWNDLGNLEQYLSSYLDLLKGEVTVFLPDVAEEVQRVRRGFSGAVRIADLIRIIPRYVTVAQAAKVLEYVRTAQSAAP